MDFYTELLVATTIQVSPWPDNLRPGQTQQFTAVVKDQLGNILVGQAVVWSLSPGLTGTVTSSGLYTAGAPSSGGVRATVGSISNFVIVSIY